MVAVSIVSFCLAVALILECIIRKSDFFSPIRIYLFFHSVALGISFLALDKSMTPFRPFTSLVYFGSALCFVLGVWTVTLLAGPGKGPVRALDFSRYNWKVHLCFSFFLFLVFLWGMMFAYHGIGVFPLFAKDKAKAIRDLFAYKWYASIALSYGGLTMALFFISIFRPRKLPRIFNLGFWMMLISVLVFSLALSRAGLMFFAAFAILFYNYAVRRLSILKLFQFFLIAALFIIVTGYLKSNGIQEKYKGKIKTEKVVRLALRIPYMYFANNFWNLDYALNPENYHERHPTTYGFTTFSGLLDGMYVPGGNLGLEIHKSTGFDDAFHKKAIKVKGWNTIGYQWDLYKDFGVIGDFLGPFIIGMLLGILYLKLTREPTLLTAASYSYLAFFLSGTFGGYMPENMIYVYGFFYLCGCCYLSQVTFSRKPHGVLTPASFPSIEAA